MGAWERFEWRRGEESFFLNKYVLFKREEGCECILIKYTFFVVVHEGRREILKQIYLFLLKIYYNWSTIYGKSHDVHVKKKRFILNNNFINNWFRKNIISKEVLIFNNNFSPRAYSVGMDIT